MDPSEIACIGLEVTNVTIKNLCYFLKLNLLFCKNLRLKKNLSFLNSVAMDAMNHILFDLAQYIKLLQINDVTDRQTYRWTNHKQQMIRKTLLNPQFR